VITFFLRTWISLHLQIHVLIIFAKHAIRSLFRRISDIRKRMPSTKNTQVKNHDNQKIQNLKLSSTTDCGKECNLVSFLSLYGIGEPLEINMRMPHKLYLKPFFNWLQFSFDIFLRFPFISLRKFKLAHSCFTYRQALLQAGTRNWGSFLVH